MRDPNRIDRIVEKLRTVWQAQPDSRPCQLVVNVAPSGEPCPRVFYFEDTDLEARLDILVAALAARQVDEPDA